MGCETIEFANSPNQFFSRCRKSLFSKQPSMLDSLIKPRLKFYQLLMRTWVDQEKGRGKADYNSKIMNLHDTL